MGSRGTPSASGSAGPPPSAPDSGPLELERESSRCVVSVTFPGCYRCRPLFGYEQGMTAADFVPAGADLAELRTAARGCRGCDLWEGATQTVFSRGSTTARVVLVGEQPGDVEDQRGEPFVGPAGVLLRRSVGDAGLDPEDLYVTNAVKHFKFRRQGKRRIH